MAVDYPKLFEAIASAHKRAPGCTGAAFRKFVRRLYRGKKVDRPWRSYPFEPAIVDATGKMVL